MSDRNLWRYGATYPVVLPRATGFALARGDLCYFDVTVLSDVRVEAPTGSQGVVKSAAGYPSQGSTLATQQGFAALFVGVNAQRWPLAGNVPPIFGGQDGLLRINTGGVFEFDKAPGAVFQVGNLVAPDVASAPGGALLPQQVALVSGKAGAIGRVERFSDGGQSTVWVRIFSAYFAPLTNA